jgi:uncharacterized protein
MRLMILLFLGCLSGIMSGFLGIGGGTIIIPVLVFSLGFSQHLAQGTTLAAMVPPIGLLAAIRYYQDNHVDIGAALLISLGFFIGGYFGAICADLLPELILKRIFGVFLLFIAMSMIFSK